MGTVIVFVAVIVSAVLIGQDPDFDIGSGGIAVAFWVLIAIAILLFFLLIWHVVHWWTHKSDLKKMSRQQNFYNINQEGWNRYGIDYGVGNLGSGGNGGGSGESVYQPEVFVSNQTSYYIPEVSVN